jgi:hypothetical protein
MSFEQTGNFHKYQEYRKIKRSLSVEYKGIDVGKAIAWSLIGIVLDGYKPTIKDYIYLPFLRIDVLKVRKAFETSEVVFSTIYESRKDHSELLSKIQASVKESSILLLAPHLKKYTLNPAVLFFAIKIIFYNAHLKHYSFLSKLSLAFNVLYTCNQVNILNQAFATSNLSSKKYVPFVSAVGIEAILTLYFNTKGVETFHIFHGLFGRYKIKIANDAINGENINTKNALAFGEATKQDIIKDFGFLENNVFVAGNPKYPAKAIKVNTKFKRALVLNGFGFYDKTFVKLIPILDEISASTGIVFDIKPHPNSNLMAFDEVKNSRNLHFISKGQSVGRLLQNSSYDFAITFNTVTYYECMYYNLICLRFAENENLNFEGLNDRFTDRESLLKKIEEFKARDVDSINIDIANLLKNTLGMGINNYNALINEHHFQ